MAVLCSCTKPIAVFHWNAKEAAMVRKSRVVAKTSWGYPKHRFYSYVICFNKSCIAKAEWKNKQQKNRFKGYKNNKPPQRKPPVQKRDTLIVKNTETDRKTTDTTSVTEAQRTIVLQDILFKVNSTEMTQPFSAPLDSLVQTMKQQPKLKIKIHGHTDNTGNEAKNVNLSRERAGVIADYLIERGIANERIRFQGFGSAQPIADNAYESSRSLNRRVEILLYE
ncbi:MAG: OmpA family protein [Cytophagales bacterium]|nr:OmpA family protein [Cytophagales bacterium]